MTGRRFDASITSWSALEKATPEEVGCALVLHVQIDGRMFAPNNLLGTIASLYGQQGAPHWLMQRISEGLQWAINALLIVPDLHQAHGAWFVLSRAGVSFDPEIDLLRLELERILPEFMLHPLIRDA